MPILGLIILFLAYNLLIKCYYNYFTMAFSIVTFIYNMNLCKTVKVRQFIKALLFCI